GVLLLVPVSRAEDLPRVEAAARPIAEGVPQVAVHRLQQLLTENLSPNEKRMGTEKLGEALCLAGRAAEALKILNDPGLTNEPEAIFWRAQALAALGRWAEALSLYQKIAAIPSLPR